MKCSQCGGTEFDEDRARADLICLTCGFVASENAITTDVEFMDGAQVAHNQVSRQITENNARKRIDIICSQLRLGADVAMSALNFYQSALFRGLTRGRPAMLISAVCVYLAARKMRLGLMLLDLSDAVSVNVFTLGVVFNYLRRKLNIVIPEADPCVLIERFASQLNFENKTSLVCTTAMQLLQRMKQDWINIGRKPNGLAAASLLVAARIHNFERSEYDVCRIAKIGMMTARKRLTEFSATASGSLSVDDFFNVNLEEEADPPAFVNGKIREAEEMKRYELSKDPVEIKKLTLEVENLSKRINDHLEMLAKKNPFMSTFSKSFESLKPTSVKNLMKDPKDSSSDDATTDRAVFKEILEDIVDPDIIEICTEDLQILTACSGNELVSIVDNVQKMRDAEDEARLASKDPSDEKDNETKKNEPEVVEDKKFDFQHNFTNSDSRFPIILPNSKTPIEEIEETEKIERTPLSLEGLDDEEIDSVYMLRPKEVLLKASLWFKENAEFLEERRRKNAEKRRFEEFNQGINKKKRKPIPRATKWINESATDCENLKLLSSGKIQITDELTPDLRQSKKINYAALEGLFSNPNHNNNDSNDNTNDSVSISNTSEISSPNKTIILPPKPNDKYVGPLLSASLKNISTTPNPHENQPATSKASTQLKGRVKFDLPDDPPKDDKIIISNNPTDNQDEIEEIPDDDYEEEDYNNWEEDADGNDLW